MSNSKGPNIFTSCNGNVHLGSASADHQLSSMEDLPVAFPSSCEISLTVLKIAPAQKLESLCPSCMIFPQALSSDLYNGNNGIFPVLLIGLLLVAT